MSDPLGRLRDIRGGMTRAFVAPEQRILYIALNKNACTSLKWMLADIMGEDTTRFDAGLLPVTHPRDVIHDRPTWSTASKLNRMSPQARAQIRPDNGWFVFAVVRDPRVRLFSAWQNKVLLQNPAFRRWHQEPWYPRHPLTPQTVVEDFEKFVTLLEEQPDHVLR